MVPSLPSLADTLPDLKALAPLCTCSLAQSSLRLMVSLPGCFLGYSVPAGTTAQKTVPSSLRRKFRPTLVACTLLGVGGMIKKGGVSSLVVNFRDVTLLELAPSASTSQR